MAGGSLLFIKDMMNKRLQGLSCSSAASTSVRPCNKRLVSPASSSRFLLNSSRLHSNVADFIDMSPAAQEPPPPPSTAAAAAAVSGGGDEVEKAAMPIMRSRSTKAQDQLQEQVVVLRVSLHCKGCAGKVKKHISKMQGVTSFHIDIATKKVTVVGDVTPLAVLTTISKVKPAQFWPSPSSPPRASASF